MRRPRWTAILCCLATLSAASPAAADSASAGRIALAAAPGGVALAIDLDALAHGLCSGDLSTPRTSAECNLIVNNYPIDPNGGQELRPGLGLWSGEHKIAGDGRVSVEVTPSNLDLAGTTLLRTPCGDWQYSLQLNPTAVQRPTLLTLHSAAKHPAQGMFAGVIEMAAVLHLVPLDTNGHPDESAAIDLPFDFTLQLAGAWATASERPPGSEDSDLLLFAGFARGKWLSRPGCEWTVFDGAWCESCLEAPKDVLRRFNVKRTPF